jgi:hypothetical protein
VNHDGGSALHGKVATLLTTLGDNASSRYSEHVAIADNNFVTVDHNFGANLAELTVLIFSGTGATKQLILDSATAGYAITEEAGLEETVVRVTAPGSGGPHTFSVVIVDAELKPFQLQQLLASTPGNAASGTLRKWLDANGRGLSKTATGVVGTQQTLTPIHTSGPAVTALPGFHYIIDSSGAVVTVTLPAAIADYDRIRISDATKSFNTNKCTVARNGNSIDGAAADYDLTFPGDWIELTGDNTNSNWIADLPSAGASTGGESGTNYFTNGSFENDATTGVSNDGGGTPVQFAEEIGTPLYGVRSCLLTSQAGTGYIDFDIGLIDTGVVDAQIITQISAHLKTDALVADGDWTAGVYDTVGAAYVVAATALIADQINIYRTPFVPLFVTASRYKLRVEFTDTTAGRTVIADKLVMTPDSNSGLIEHTGPILYQDLSTSDFINDAGISAVTGRLSMQRVAGSLHVTSSMYFSGTGTDVAPLKLTLPTYQGETLLTIDGEWAGGIAQQDPTATGSTSNLFIHTTASDTGLAFSWQNVPGDELDGNSFGSSPVGRIIQMAFSTIIPIQNWQNQGKVNLLTQDVVQANAQVSYDLSTTSSQTLIDFSSLNTKIEKKGDWLNDGAGAITIPADGTYDMDLSIAGDWGSNIRVVMEIGLVQALEVAKANTAASTADTLKGSASYTFSKGDSVTFRASGATNVNVDAIGSFVMLKRRQDYGAFEPVGFGLATATRYGMVKKNLGFKVSASASMTAAAADIMENLAVTHPSDFDDDSAYNTSTNRYEITANRAGLWSFQATQVTSGNLDGEFSGPRILVNGTTVTTYWSYAGAGPQDIRSGVSITLRLVAGDYVQVQRYSSVSRTIAANQDTFFSGHRIGD